MKTIVKKMLRSKELVVILLIIIIFLILSFGSDAFLNLTNFESMQASIAPNAIIAAGMMILLISGVFDLSVGSVERRRPKAVPARSLNKPKTI